MRNGGAERSNMCPTDQHVHCHSLCVCVCDRPALQCRRSLQECPACRACLRIDNRTCAATSDAMPSKRSGGRQPADVAYHTHTHTLRHTTRARWQ